MYTPLQARLSASCTGLHLYRSATLRLCQDTCSLTLQLMIKLAYGFPCYLNRLCLARMVTDSTKTTSSENKLLKARPSHFLAIQITDKETRFNFAQLQQHFINANPAMKRAAVPAAKVHVTLFVFSLTDKNEVALAGQVLESVSLPSRRCSCQAAGAAGCEICRLKFAGLGAFNKRVLFVSIVENEALCWLRSVRESLLTAFSTAGLTALPEPAWKPHLTLAKSTRLPRRQQRQCRLSTDGLVPNDGGFVGWQALKSVQLCSMAEADAATGYFRVLAERTFQEQ